MINPIWLRTFVTLVDTGHFTKTAEKLFMTQPGVSQHINKLEQACGHILIKRENKSFVVNEQGYLVYEYAKNMQMNEHALVEALGFDDPLSGQCSIACSGALALLLYPKLLEHQTKHTNAIIKLKVAPNNQILKNIKEGGIDLGIVTDIPNRGLFEYKKIGKEELCLVFPANTNTDIDKEKLLLNTGLISHPDAEHYLSLYIAQCEERKLRKLDMSLVPVTGFVNQLSQLLLPVQKGLGFTVMPKSALDSLNSLNGLSVLKSDRPVIETLYLVYKKNRVLPARYEALCSIIDTQLNPLRT